MTTTTSSPAPAASPGRTAPPQVEVVVPVHDEAGGLERRIRRLHRFLCAEFPFSWRIVVADNASTDATLAIARRLEADLPHVRALHLDRKGRGRALRAAWSASDAPVVAYMDVDLSTDLRALLPLVAPLLSGHSDVAIGTHEVPVDWIDDPDSRVDLVRTALADLRGIARLALAAPLVRFLLVGVASTAAYALLYLLLRGGLGPAGANAAALAVTAVANTAANRRLTFGLRGRDGLARQHVMGAAVFLLCLGLTSGALAAVHGLVAHPSRPVELAVLIAASVVATATRYAALRAWVFARSLRPTRPPPSEGQ